MYVSFKDFSILALAIMAISKPIDKVKWSGTICAISVEGIVGTFL